MTFWVPDPCLWTQNTFITVTFSWLGFTFLKIKKNELKVLYECVIHVHGACTWMCRCVYTLAFVQRPEQDFGCFSLLLFTTSFRQESLTEREVAILARLASQWAPGISHLHPSTPKGSILARLTTQWAPGISLSPLPKTPSLKVYIHILLSLTFYMDIGDLNSGP